ncbi:uncharacterized protein SCHCODRAFT_02613804 [Schizophyllum commune H4-8]|uniref:uncharacterized protein n=1 Tax=Schizophyllum commune (strain H4-8 / FGSC 9210) TaxID=578458 RepID=UPI002160FA01|nr:uncharacterized protein SCHCODRAFT_02613804 [Schizophyllum commune H4-8]KAI5896031.1 hypothetical protein SCHCODRAFT_02613804 [Schizophyllum commune H4-8]
MSPHSAPDAMGRCFIQSPPRSSPSPMPKRVPVSSTARSSTHRTGEFAVLGSARDAYIDAPRPSWLRSCRGPQALGRSLAIAQVHTRWPARDRVTAVTHLSPNHHHHYHHLRHLSRARSSFRLRFSPPATPLPQVPAAYPLPHGGPRSRPPAVP